LKVRFLFVAALTFFWATFPAVGLGAGPKTIAKIDRSLWSEPLSAPQGFDAASFAENIAFSHVFQGYWRDLETQLAALKVKQVQQESLERWRRETTARLIENINAALKGCRGSLVCGDMADVEPAAFEAAAEAAFLSLASRRPEWAAAAEEFYKAYVSEQMRLAALFPKPSSEILAFSNEELTGYELPEKTFLLTFDDGPTSSNGETDKLAAFLRDNNLTALFFVLKDPFEKRLEKSGKAGLADLYAGQCVGVHGANHKPHPSLETWPESIDSTWDAVAAALPGKSSKLVFRPPYGQRNQDIISFVSLKKGKLMLWNIDSQDWHSKVSAKDAANRVTTLMLLWRRGIILFHDIHRKAREALPHMLDDLNGAGVNWSNCREFM